MDKHRDELSSMSGERNKTVSLTNAPTLKHFRPQEDPYVEPNSHPELRRHRLEQGD